MVGGKNSERGESEKRQRGQRREAQESRSEEKNSGGGQRQRGQRREEKVMRQREQRREEKLEQRRMKRSGGGQKGSETESHGEELGPANKEPQRERARRRGIGARKRSDGGIARKVRIRSSIQFFALTSRAQAQ